MAQQLILPALSICLIPAVTGTDILEGWGSTTLPATFPGSTSHPSTPHSWSIHLAAKAATAPRTCRTLGCHLWDLPSHSVESPGDGGELPASQHCTWTLPGPRGGSL